MLEARRRRSQQAFYRRFDGRDLGDGLYASVTPAAPGRSLFNAVTYADPASVVAARDSLAALYAEAGVRAWTVWVAPEDRELADVLAAAGHRVDATPEGMACALDDINLTGPDIGSSVSWEDMIAVNEAAYGAPAGAMRMPRLDGIALVGVPGRSVVGVLDCDGDAWVGMVATHPTAQRQGLSTALIKQALRAARERGCTTSSLEASAAGRPVYERLGYRPLGRLAMWEHSTAEAS